MTLLSRECFVQQHMELDTLSPPLLFTLAGAQLAGTCMFILHAGSRGFKTNEQTDRQTDYFNLHAHPCRALNI